MICFRFQSLRKRWKDKRVKRRETIVAQRPISLLETKKIVFENLYKRVLNNCAAFITKFEQEKRDLKVFQYSKIDQFFCDDKY